MDDTTMKAMRAKLEAVQIAKGTMQDTYPFLLAEAELKRLPLGEPVLLSVDEVDGGVAAVLSTLALRDLERSKIDCARKFFAKLAADNPASGVRYNVADSYSKLIDLLS